MTLTLEIFKSLITFFQRIVEQTATFVDWLWTPNEALNFIGENTAPIGLITFTAILVILGLHIAHLVNVVAG